MIVESVMNLIKMVILSFLSILPTIPQMPSNFVNDVDLVLDTIFNNLDLLGVFIRPSTLIIIAPLLIVIINFERIYHFGMWILRKIPFIGIQ